MPENLPSAFYNALEEFNQGAYFACHETLEVLWIPEKRAVRELYQGVLQIAVGCYHLVERTNWVGAVNKLEAGARRLERALPDDLRASKLYGVDWGQLITDADTLQAHLRTLGRGNCAHFENVLLPKILFSL